MLVNIRVTAVIVAFEIGRRGFAAQIAVDALLINVEFSRNVLRIFVCGVRHSFPSEEECSGEKFVNAAAKVCSNSNGRIASPSCCNLCNAPIPCHRKLASLYREITETAV